MQNVRKTMPTFLTATALTLGVFASLLAPQAAAEGDACNNSGVQVVVGDYKCQAQFCDNTSGAGAGAGSGGPSGSNAASAGATAGNECTQSGGNTSNCNSDDVNAPSMATPSVPDVPEDTGDLDDVEVPPTEPGTIDTSKVPCPAIEH